MKKAMRIVAVHAGDIEDPQDEDWKIVFDGIINENDNLLKQWYFGYSLEPDEDLQINQKWPFILMNSPQGFEFGPGCGEEHFESTNIFDKEIRINTLFTRGKGPEESTYRVINIDPLT